PLVEPCERVLLEPGEDGGELHAVRLSDPRLRRRGRDRYAGRSGERRRERTMEPSRVMFRQGDVLVMEVAAIPDDAVAVPSQAGRFVLADGEVTGHAHVVPSGGTALLDDDGERYLRVTGEQGAPLTHEEHDTIVLPPGDYAVVRQREYTPERVRP